MPRTARASIGGIVYHVLSRGNRHATVFLDSDDYDDFQQLMRDACERIAMRVLAYCLMPNHFHLVLWPFTDHDLGRWMHWLLTSQVRRYHERHASDGRVWQGRFKAFPIQDDRHLFTVVRYVERNPVRAQLVDRSCDWRWNSARWWRASTKPSFLVEGPLGRPTDWASLVDVPLTESELQDVRHSISKGRPFGDPTWVATTAAQLGLESTMRPRGRPALPKV